MIEGKNRGHVESASVVRQIRPGLSECIIRIDFSDYVIFYDPMVLMSYINHDVTYLTRPDIINGIEKEVICEIALVTEVVTLPANEAKAKLVPIDVKRPVCNFNINDIRFGEFKVGCIGLLTKIEMGQSSKASWYDCFVLDAYGHLFNLRIFMSSEDVQDPDKFNAMVNGYVEFNLQSTKYGYQTSEIKAINEEVKESPEIAIARDIVLRYINSDTSLKTMFNDLSVETSFNNYVDTEPGYIWVRIASELYFIDAIDNTTAGLNVQAMRRAAVCTRLYTMSHKFPWSHSTINITKLAKFKDLVEDEDFREMIDVYYNKQPSDSKIMYYRIRNLVDSIISIRRGISNEEDFRKTSNYIDDCRNMFNGML